MPAWRKHQQHLINHNLSRIRIHYHQEVGVFSPSVSGLHQRKMRLEASCDRRQFWGRKSERLMYDCHGNVGPRCQGDSSGRLEFGKNHDHNTSPLKCALKQLYHYLFFLTHVDIKSYFKCGCQYPKRRYLAWLYFKMSEYTVSVKRVFVF